MVCLCKSRVYMVGLCKSRVYMVGLCKSRVYMVGLCKSHANVKTRNTLSIHLHHCFRFEHFLLLSFEQSKESIESSQDNQEKA